MAERVWIGELIAQLHRGKIDRREFMKRAAAAGLSASLISQVVAAHAARAQEGTPASVVGQVGMPGIEHITDTSKGTIRLYSSWPMIAASAQIGGDSAEAVRLALEDFGNAAGGFALEYEALDDAIASTGSWDPGKEAENANRVVSDMDAMVYIATYNSGAAKISIPILNQAEPGPMAMISPANTYPGLSKSTEFNDEGEPDIYYPTGKRNYMRVVPSDEIQGGAAANWAYNENGNRRAYVLHDNQLYGKGLASVFEATFRELGGEILGFEGFDPNAPSYRALMTSIASRNPDLVYLGAIVNLNASKLLQDMRAVMPADRVAFLGPDGLINQAFIDGAGDAAEGAYITFGGVPASALEGIGADWAQRMRERLGHEPDAYAAYSYEAAVVAIQAIDQVQEKDRVKILDAMFATEGFNGLLGTWSFTETGDTDSTTVSLNQVQGGQITFLKRIGRA